MEKEFAMWKNWVYPVLLIFAVLSAACMVLYPFVLLYHSGSSAMLSSLTLGAATVIIVGWICTTFLMYMTFYIASKLLNSEEKSDSAE